MHELLVLLVSHDDIITLKVYQHTKVLRWRCLKSRRRRQPTNKLLRGQPTNLEGLLVVLRLLPGDVPVEEAAGEALQHLKLVEQPEAKIAKRSFSAFGKG